MLSTINCKSKLAAALVLALAGVVSCVSVDSRLGGNLVPIDQQYVLFSADVPIDEIDMRPTDSLSGFSQKRIVIGSIRDSVFGLSTRASALTIVPVGDTLDFGNVQKIHSFYFDASFDSLSVPAENQKRILQDVYVYSLSEGVDIGRFQDCNNVAGAVRYDKTSIIRSTPVLNGTTDLLFQFTDEYAWRVVNACKGKVMSRDFRQYLDEVPGIYICTDDPKGEGGRFNFFSCQLGYSSSSQELLNTYATLSVSTIYEGGTEPKDTTFLFMYGMMNYNDADSLINNVSHGSYPQYAFNVTSHESRAKAGAAAERAWLEGGGGLKPVIKSTTLRNAAIKTICDTLRELGLPEEYYTKAVINKASLILPYEMPADYTEMDYFPRRIAPTCKIATDTTAAFAGLSDSSSESENQGNINRATRQYEPDITYHVQQLINMNPESEQIRMENYDVWLLLMGSETTVTENHSSEEMNEYYQYLAYQNYYNNMYGGYNSGYGYGYGDSYSNYYSYMLAAMYANANSTTTSTDFELDPVRFYHGSINGPSAPGRKPYLKLTFSIRK